MVAELFHALVAVCLLSLLIAFIYLTFTDLPLEPFLFGEALGMPGGITLLVLTSPRGRRR